MTVSHRAPDVLRAHPLNERVYDADRDGEELRASIAEHGILTPLVIDQHGTILSGHRRWQAARDLGLGRVPVVVRHIDEPLEAEHVLLESNRQREKTYSERMREAEHLERIVAERNRRRMLAGKAADPLPTLVGGASDTRTVAQVAEAVGLKRETYRKVRRVYDTAAGKPDATGSPPPPHARQVATEQMAALDAGETTPHAAARAVQEVEARGELHALLDAIAAAPFDAAVREPALDRLHEILPSLPEDDLVKAHDFAAGLALQGYAGKAHLVAAYVRRHGEDGLGAAARAFGTSRKVVAGLLILHEEAQGGVRFRPMGLELGEGLPRERWLEILQTITSLTEASDATEDGQVLDECRQLVRQMVRR